MNKLLVVVLALVCISDALSAIYMHEERMQFEEYKTKFNKVYESEQENERRFENFLQTLKRLPEVRKQFPKATFDLTKFSDMSPKEFEMTRLNPTKTNGQALARSCLAQGVTAPHMDASAIPTSFDWRTKNVVTPVKDQGDCGSCWAFSTIGHIESQWAIAGHPLTQFSEQLLVDCSQGCSNEPPYGNVCNQGCNGGWPWNAYIDVLSWKGVETETQYPYTGVDGTCAFDKTKVQAPFKNYTCLSSQQNSNGADEDQMAAYLVANGTLSVALDADYLQDYTSGVIDPWFGWECDGTQLDHAVLIVGYGVDSSEIFGDTPYWIVKNSWGSDFGENGYFRIARGKGACGINNAVSAVFY